MSAIANEVTSSTLQETRERLTQSNDRFLGYPVSKDFDYSTLADFLELPMNNLGDPFVEGTYKVQSHEMEREVIAFFASMFEAPKDDYWGYVTSGGTEGNLYASFLARELYPDAVFYYGADAHYSIKKALHLLRVPSKEITSSAKGEICYSTLESALRENHTKPAVVIATFGTTMTEAKDDISKIKSILRTLGMEQHYIHCDAALAGPFGRFMPSKPQFNFAAGADSVSISGHKFIGSPMPSGVVLTRMSYRNKIAQTVDYIGSIDSTITGSRNGHAPLFLWYALKTLGLEGLKSRYEHSVSVAKYSEARLKAIGIDAWRNTDSITVVIPNMANSVKTKWQLATEGGMSHVICMPNVTRVQIDSFVGDVMQARGCSIRSNNCETVMKSVFSPRC